MKHKKQLRKAQDERKAPGDLERSADISSESDVNEKTEELKRGLEPDSFILEENDEDDDVDIEDDICSPDHLL